MRSIRHSLSAVAAAGIFMLPGSALPAEENVKIIVVYDATQLPHDHYTVVRRLAVEGRPWWHTTVAHRELAPARRALVEEAARIGADGIINLYCVSKADGAIPREGHYCYANAIRLRERTPREAVLAR
jgi:hypothetical protein